MKDLAGETAGVPPLRSLYLYLTSSCNLRCRHCWVSPSFVTGVAKVGEYLELDLLKKAVSEAKPLGLRSAKLTGGEPLLHPQFLEVVDYLTAEELGLTLETNGTRIDAPIARHLKEKSNVSFVSVSIDGPTAEVHDPFRGVPGSFDAAVQGFRHLVDAGYRPQLIMAIYRNNACFLGDMIELAEILGAGSVKFSPTVPTGRGVALHERGEGLDFEEVLALVGHIRGDLQRTTSLRLMISTPLAFCSVAQLLQDGGGPSCHVQNILGLLGSGEMSLCGIGRTIPELCFGSLKEKSLAATWQGHPLLQRLRRDLNGEHPGLCGQCIHSRRCLTYCVAQNYQDSGKLLSPTWLCAEANSRGVFPVSRLRRQR